MTDLQPTENSDQPSLKRMGCLFYSIAILLVLVLMASLSYMAWYRNSMRALRIEMEKIVARGEPLWLAELAPEGIDPSEDGTPLYLAALAKLKPTTQGFNELLSAEPATPPGFYLEFETELKQNRSALQLLAQAVHKPRFRLRLDYNTKQPFAILIQPIQDAREFARLLQADVLQSLGEGNSERAVGAIEDALGLCEMLRDEPFFISQLVRIAIGGTAINSLKTTVAHIDLTPEQFAELDDQLTRMEDRFTLVPSVFAERAASFTTMNNLDQNTGLAGGSPSEFSPLKVLDFPAFRPYVMGDEAFMLRTMSDFAALVDRPGPEGQQAITALDERFKNASTQYVISRLITPAVLHCRTAGLRHRQRIATARLGIRVARYFAEHGKFPDMLDLIVDDKLSSVHVDLFSGRPLVYKVLPDGFMIYPVGEDGVDNGGGMTPDNTEGSCKFEVKYPKLPRDPEAPTDR